MRLFSDLSSYNYRVITLTAPVVNRCCTAIGAVQLCQWPIRAQAACHALDWTALQWATVLLSDKQDRTGCWLSRQINPISSGVTRN